MQNKGIVICTAVLLTLASIFYLSFSVATGYYDSQAAKIKDPIFRKIGGVLALNSVQILILAFNFSYDGLADLAATCLLFLLVTSFYNGQKGANIGKVFYWFYPLHLLALSLFRIAFLLFLM